MTSVISIIIALLLSVATQGVVTQTSPVDPPHTLAGCAPTAGTFKATNNAIDPYGEVLSRKDNHVIEYKILGVQDDECHFNYTQTDIVKAGSFSHSAQCIARTPADLDDFFTSWKASEFFNSMLAFCNPDNESTEGKWECNFHAGIKCSVDKAPWMPDTHG